MKEISNISASLKNLDEEDKKMVLATVVRVRGSSYRNPGARMLIYNHGKWIGSISGGCLEGDAMKKAREVMESGEPKLVTYDTMEDDSNELRIGLGCNGIIDVLLEPVHQDANPDEYLSKLLDIESPCVLATVFESDAKGYQTGDRVLFQDLESSISFKETLLEDLVKEDAHACLNKLQSATRKYDIESGGAVSVLFEVIQPPIELLIFGAGPDAQPVSALAKTLGWKVRLSDECVAHLAPVKFPDADQVIGCQRDLVYKHVPITPYTAIVLMSHNYDYDCEVLKQIIDSPSPYIGIMGPTKRTDKIFEELEIEGITIKQKDLQRIHTPVGLDIGADSPDEIALSILSEILARFSGRSGGFLKYHNGPIHKREGVDDQVFKQMYLNNDEDLQDMA